MSTITQPTGQLSRSRTGPAAAATPGTSLLGKILHGLLIFLKWVAIAIVAAFVAVLIGISIFWGPTPWPVAGPLGVAWVGLLAGLGLAARRYHSGRAVGAAVAGFVVLALVTVIISQASAYTPPIVDANGQGVPGSIASLEKVRLNGSEQWISIRGKRASNPVLLFLAGGPGGSQLATARYALGGLEDHFVVVDWEQPGSGKSFDAIDRSALTPERYITDAHALISYLQQRFGQEKVYVLGESWGSALGIWLAQRYPDQIQAFIGTGQMVAFLETDVMCYDFAMRWARERGDTNKVAKLEAQGPPPYYGNDVAMKQVTYLADTLAYMNQNPAIYAGDGDTIRDLLSPEYGLYDKVSWVRGLLDTLNIVYPQLWQVDFRTQATRLDVPVYFLLGRHDVNAPPVITEQYYQILKAPHKELVWFEHSGHTPWTREPEQFVDVVVNNVLADTQATR
jgi:pimeloyl-ACP methyl ester carboxylesterase